MLALIAEATPYPRPPGRDSRRNPFTKASDPL